MDYNGIFPIISGDMESWYHHFISIFLYLTFLLKLQKYSLKPKPETEYFCLIKNQNQNQKPRMKKKNVFFMATMSLCWRRSTRKIHLFLAVLVHKIRKALCPMRNCPEKWSSSNYLVAVRDWTFKWKAQVTHL